jgi:cytochrome c oxidase cbb3-type subunit 4
MESLVEWAKALWGLWLMLVFLGIVAYVMWPGRKRTMDEHARIPLEDPLDESERKRNGRQD